MELSWKDLQLRQTGMVLSHDELRQLREEERHAKQEVEANVFAAELLMPADLVRQLARKHRGDIDTLKQVFNVSRQAMEVRLVSLKLKRDFEANLWCDPQLLLL
jgi:Zn-dependent peptidase ImmA (M78 family)